MTDILAVATTILLAATGVWVLAARPRATLNRAFAVLLVLMAGSTLVFSVYRTAGSPQEAIRLIRTITWYELPFTFLITLFVDRLVFGSPVSTTRRVLLGTLAAFTAAMMILHQTWPDAFHVPRLDVPPDAVRHTVISRWGSIAIGLPLVLAQTWAVVAGTWAANDLSRSTFQRRQAALIGFAFFIPLLHAAMTGAISILLIRPDTFLSDIFAPIRVANVVSFAACIICWPLLVRPFDGWTRRILVIAPLLPLLGAVYDQRVLSSWLLPWTVDLPRPEAFINTRVAWLAGFAVLAATAVVRYGLAGVDADDRSRITQATAGLLVVGAVGVTVAAVTLTRDVTVPLSLLVIIATLAAVALLVSPLRRLPSAVTDRLLLDPHDPDVMRERIRVYTAALRAGGSGASAPVRNGTDPVIDALRRELGLTRRDHALLVASVFEPESAPMPQVLFGRYFVEDRLGSGGQGAAYLARDSVLGRPVVVKRLAGAGRGRGREQALAEARALGRVDHPNVLRVFDVQVEADDAYLMVEYAAGGSLGDRLTNDGPLPLDEALGLARKIAEGVEAIHASGLVHGDLKAENILFTAQGSLRVADLGAARATAFADEPLTVTMGMPMATPSSMAPEQAEGGTITQATDVYALAALVHRMVTGRGPIDLEGLNPAAAAARLSGHEPALDDARVAPIAAVLRQALARDPADRPIGVVALVEALEPAAATVTVQTALNTKRDEPTESTQPGISGRGVPGANSEKSSRAGFVAPGKASTQ